jgi:hypothetical protein
MSDFDLDDLASELAEFDAPETQAGRPPHEERIIAGFEDIQRFVEQHGRVPEHGEARDIFERIYAVRLDRIRALEECRAIVIPLDHQGLLAGDLVSVSQPVEAMDDDALMAELEGMDDTSDITKLRHVRTSAEKREAEEIANRERCMDFEQFRALFEGVVRDLTTGARIALAIRKDAGFLKSDIKAGEFFILFGQTAYVAEVGKKIRAPNGETDARLRVIYSNGTESNLLLRSLQRALYKDETSRKISETTLGPLFDSNIDETDLASGTVYVLRSKSDHPTVTAHREVLHKIGVTGGDVSRRLTNARLDPTFLLADVEIVATYELFNINRTRLENLIHRIFREARLDIEIKDRFGQPVIPREWFLVPLYVVDEAIEKIRAGTITEYVYDPKKAALVKAAPALP